MTMIVINSVRHSSRLRVLGCKPGMLWTDAWEPWFMLNALAMCFRLWLCLCTVCNQPREASGFLDVIQDMVDDCQEELDEVEDGAASSHGVSWVCGCGCSRSECKASGVQLWTVTQAGRLQPWFCVSEFSLNPFRAGEPDEAANGGNASSPGGGQRGAGLRGTESGFGPVSVSHWAFFFELVPAMLPVNLRKHLLAHTLY